MITPSRAHAMVGRYGATEAVRRFVPRWSTASFGTFAVAASAVLVLLLAIVRVAHHAVDQGEQRRRDAALYWQATWKCQALRARVQHLDCLERLQGTPSGAAPRTTPTATVATPARRVADGTDR